MIKEHATEYHGLNNTNRSVRWLCLTICSLLPKHTMWKDLWCFAILNSIHKQLYAERQVMCTHSFLDTDDAIIEFGFCLLFSAEHVRNVLSGRGQWDFFTRLPWLLVGLVLSVENWLDRKSHVLTSVRLCKKHVHMSHHTKGNTGTKPNLRQSCGLAVSLSSYVYCFFSLQNTGGLSPRVGLVPRLRVFPVCVASPLFIPQSKDKQSG